MRAERETPASEPAAQWLAGLRGSRVLGRLPAAAAAAAAAAAVHANGTDSPLPHTHTQHVPSSQGAPVAVLKQDLGPFRAAWKSTAPIRGPIERRSASTGAPQRKRLLTRVRKALCRRRAGKNKALPRRTKDAAGAAHCSTVKTQCMRAHGGKARFNAPKQITHCHPEEPAEPREHPMVCVRVCAVFSGLSHKVERHHSTRMSIEA